MDISRVKNKINKLNSSNGNDDLYRLKEGTQIVRIVPYKFDKDWPFTELLFHYGIGKDRKTYLSPQSFERPDPIAEMGEALRREGKDGWKKAKPFLPKLRTYVPIVVRGEEDQGIRFWSFGKTVFEDILTLLDDDGAFGLGDITHPLTGYDLKVEYISAEDAGQQYPKTVLTPARKPSKLSEDKDEIKKLLKEQKDINEIFTELSYEDLEDILEKWVNPNASDDDDEEEDEKPKKRSVKKLAKTRPTTESSKKRKVKKDDDDEDKPWDDDADDDTTDTDDDDDDDDEWSSEFDEAFDD
jgi:hypothetical protein